MQCLSASFHGNEQPLFFHNVNVLCLHLFSSGVENFGWAPTVRAGLSQITIVGKQAATHPTTGCQEVSHNVSSLTLSGSELYLNCHKSTFLKTW